jgi:glycosyltransferase involved in cell wall biosynthesis
MLAFKRKIRSFKPDFLFGHFLYPSGYTAHHLGKDLNVPSVLMMGESSIKSYESYPQRLMQRLLHSFRHIITVSQNLKDKTVFGYGVPSERVTYIPNGVDVTQFKPFSKSEARHRLGLDQNTCYAIFVGSFIHRKGPLRVLEAVRNYKIPIKLIFVGRGDLELSGPEVVFKGTVKHQEMPLYLAAADVFVLPTLAEGMSNAILEAMAVGLPIVTSDLDFNREFLSPETAMLVDPLNTESIAKAILAIQQEPSRQQALSEAALTLSSSYSIQNRAKKIHDILLTHYLEKKP